MDHSQTLTHKNLLFAAIGDLIRRRLRSLVVTLCLAAILFPLLTALAISEGLRFQAEIGVRQGADIYISEDLCGGEGPISLDYLEALRALPDASRVSARVVGRAYFVDRLVAVIGLDREALLALEPLVKGDVPKARGEVIVGQGIAREFGVKPGMRFTVAANNRKVFAPTGILSPSCLWSSDVMVMHYKDANEFFRKKGYATQILLYTSSQPAAIVAKSIGDLTGSGGTRVSCLQIKERSDIDEMLRSGYGHRGGIFTVLFVIGAALAIPAFLITSGFGMRELYKEIGVLKATGWRTREVLEKVTLENLLISLTAVSLSILLSMVWIKGLNGILIAQFYIAEVGLVPDVDIPSRYLPSHAIFCLLFALGVTLVGGLFSAWNKTRVPPSELMR